MSDPGFPAWAIAVIVILVFLVIIFVAIYAIRACFRKSCVLAPAKEDYALEKHLPLVSQKDTKHVPANQISDNQDALDKPQNEKVPEGIDITEYEKHSSGNSVSNDEDFRISLSVPPKSTSLFSDKFELSSEDMAELYKKYMNSETADTGGFVSIDLGTGADEQRRQRNRLSVAFSQKAATLKTTLDKSLRRKSTTQSSTSSTPPLHELFGVPPVPNQENDDMTQSSVANSRRSSIASRLPRRPKKDAASTKTDALSEKIALDDSFQLETSSTPQIRISDDARSSHEKAEEQKDVSSPSPVGARQSKTLVGEFDEVELAEPPKLPTVDEPVEDTSTADSSEAAAHRVIQYASIRSKRRSVLPTESDISLMFSQGRVPDEDKQHLPQPPKTVQQLREQPGTISSVSTVKAMLEENANSSVGKNPMESVRTIRDDRKPPGAGPSPRVQDIVKWWQQESSMRTSNSSTSLNSTLSKSSTSDKDRKLPQHAADEELVGRATPRPTPPASLRGPPQHSLSKLRNSILIAAEDISQEVSDQEEDEAEEPTSSTTTTPRATMIASSPRASLSSLSGMSAAEYSRMTGIDSNDSVRSGTGWVTNADGSVASRASSSTANSHRLSYLASSSSGSLSLRQQHLISLSLKARQQWNQTGQRPAMPPGFVPGDDHEVQGPEPTVSFSRSTVRTMIPDDECRTDSTSNPSSDIGGNKGSLARNNPINQRQSPKSTEAAKKTADASQETQKADDTVYSTMREGRKQQRGAIPWMQGNDNKPQGKTLAQRERDRYLQSLI